jgi:dihydrofolate reductase
MATVSLIAAMSLNHVIGQENHLVWNLPADWENFQRVTEGHIFIMGRKSYQAEDALISDRHNLILSRQENLSLGENSEQVQSLEQALEHTRGEEEIFILGGASVFEQALPLADYLYLTIVHDFFDGDAFFPVVDWRNWQLTKSRLHRKDERHDYTFAMNEYQRRV